MAQMRTEYIVSLINRVSRPARRIVNSLAGIRPAAEGVRTSIDQQLGGAIGRNNRRLADARGGIVDAVAGFYTLRAAIGAPVRAAMRFESAMADVRKVVDFETPDGFERMSRDIRQLAKEIPISADGLAQIAAAAGEAGFAEQDIVKVTRAAAQMGVALGISADAAGDALPGLMNGMGLTLDEAQLLADGINHLSNNMASGAPEVLDFMTRIGADSKAFGFSAEQAAAFGSAMIATNAESNVAATSFRNMGKALTKGASATGRQVDAFETLGMSAEQVAADMQRDAVGTTLDVIDALSRVPKEAQAALMNDLFGSEARALTPLLTNTALLRQSLGLVGDQTAYAGSVLEEYNVRSATFGNRVQLLRNRLNDFGVVLGNALIPGLTRLMNAIVPLLERFGEFAEAHPELIANVVALAAGLVAVRVAAAALKFVGLLGRGGALALLSIGFKTVGKAAIAARAAIAGRVGLDAALAKMSGRRFGGVARLGSALRGIAGLIIPAGLAKALAMVAGAVAAIGAAKLAIIGAALGAVAAAGAWIHRNWEGIAAVLSGVGDAIRDRFGPAFEVARHALAPFKEALAPVVDLIGGLGEKLSGIGRSVRESFSGMFARTEFSEADIAGLRSQGDRVATAIIDAILFPFVELPGKIVQAIGDVRDVLFQTGVDLMNGLWDGIKSRFEAITSSVRSFIVGIGAEQARARADRNNLPDRSSPPGFRGNGGVGPGRAFGGSVTAGMAHPVGEMGAELFLPEVNGSIISNRTLMRAMSEQAAALRESGAFGASLGRAASQARAPRRGIGGMSINLGGITINGGGDMRAAADEIASEIGRAVQDTLDGLFPDEAQ